MARGPRPRAKCRLSRDIGSKIDGRHLIIVEDILDSGVTLSFLMKVLKARGAASIRLCTLLSKPERRKVDVPVDYLGFEIPDAFGCRVWPGLCRKNIEICRISAF